MNKKRLHEFILRNAKKLKAVNILGGKCLNCGDDKISHLVFHHRSNKEFKLAELFGTGRWSLIKDEIEKCDLLCRNCHGEMHATEVTNQKNNRRRNKKIILEAINKFECELCGYNKCNNVLQFHHKNENAKKFSITDKINTICLSSVKDITQTILHELDKCIIVCANCHGDQHFQHDLYNTYLPEIIKKIEIYRETPIVNSKKIIDMYNNGARYKEIMEKIGCSRASIQKYVH